MKFYIKTLGCKVNQYEGAAIAGMLSEKGFTQAKSAGDAEIVIINTCTVTENSDRKVKQLLQSAKSSENPPVTVVAGCFPQAFPREAEILGADIIIGTSERKRLPQIIEQFISKRNRKTDIVPTDTEYEDYAYSAASESAADKTRATIKIEDGCNRSCAYCIIPKARGSVRSRPIDEIVTECRTAALSGHKEIVLAGINISCYGLDGGYETGLCEVVEAVAGIDGIERVRLSSLEPDMMTKGVINRLASVKKLCPHFHMSLQSGCDATLRRMNRLYTQDGYAESAKFIWECFENPAITTDIIVGFAGETDEDFEESLRFVDEMRFAKVHVFTYSIRKGTKAAEWDNHVEKAIKTERYKMMSNAAEKSRREFLTSQIGKTSDILIEKRKNSEFLFGHTANYTPVRIYGSEAKRHDIVKAVINGVSDDYCIVHSGISKD